MKIPKRAAVYVRISNDPYETRPERDAAKAAAKAAALEGGLAGKRQREALKRDREAKARLGVKRQREDCEKLAKSKGWAITAVYEDNDVSAFSGKERPEYRRLLQDIEVGAVDGVLVYHLSRLHRRPAELETFMTLADSKSIPLASVSGDVDLSTSHGRLVARLMGTVDTHESEVKSERIRRKHLELAENGKVVGGGSRPLGYTPDRMQVVPDEARMIREASKRLLAGDTLNGICTGWNAQGKLTPLGSQWRASVLRKSLCSARVAGHREYEGKLHKGEWPPILPLPEWTRLRRLLRDPARRTGSGARLRFLVSGLLHCGHCDGLLTAQKRQTGKRVFVCNRGAGRPNCGKMSVVAAELEELVKGAVIAILDRPRLAVALRRHTREDAQEDGLLEAIRTDEAQLDELAALWAEKKIGSSEWMRAREGVEARVRDARARLGASDKSSAVAEFIGKPGALARGWSALSIDRQRAVIRTVIEKVTIQPARAAGVNVFDPARVKLAWRY